MKISHYFALHAQPSVQFADHGIDQNSHVSYRVGSLIQYRNPRMAKKKQGHDFEQSLTDLEQLVEQMESGDLSLEKALKTFEHGIQLTRHCQTMLNEAEQKVQLLIDDNGTIKAHLFDPDDPETK